LPRLTSSVSGDAPLVAVRACVTGFTISYVLPRTPWHTLRHRRLWPLLLRVR
jgi:hypothetical protein